MTDELTNARFSRDIKRLRAKHYEDGLEDPIRALTEIAARYGIEVDTAIKEFLSDSLSKDKIDG